MTRAACVPRWVSVEHAILTLSISVAVQNSHSLRKLT